MSIYLNIGIILFLVIFAVAAALTLLSLIGKVKMEKSYQNKLFTVLLIEVIGTIIAFVSYNLKPDFTPNISEKILMSNNGYWEWSFPEGSWRTRIYFTEDTVKKFKIMQIEQQLAANRKRLENSTNEESEELMLIIRELEKQRRRINEELDYKN
jgi:glucan phosphoethanolaminetransferase (alkaline phosphatase superfamily)